MHFCLKSRSSSVPCPVRETETVFGYALTRSKPQMPRRPRALGDRLRVDRIVVESVGQWPGFDLTCRVSIDAPNLSVALDLFGRLLFDISRDAYQINPARAVFNRLLAIAFQQLLPEQLVAPTTSIASSHSITERGRELD
jgi:hypothetical protein